AGDPFTCYARVAGGAGDGGAADAGTTASGGDCCTGLGTCGARPGSSDPAAASYGASTCAGDLVCIPKPADELPDGGATPSCKAKFGTIELEGRCLPRCFTSGNPLAAQLTIGDCPTDSGIDDVICAPCFNPIDGSSTGACSRQLPDGGTDAPVEAAKRFAECGAWGDGGAKMGLCVPEALVGTATANPDLVPKDTCGTGELCAPRSKVVDQGSCFKKCASSLAPEAVCVPTYLVEATPAGAGFSGVLGQSDCESGETCTVCVSPIDQTSTGACDN
ncbi:MAG: hypothetical protein FJ104_10975, partial [Deltaproteobacteria bacterium]|nr:hypothetical protein [Deltaproteobacteria bacterium]